MSAVLEIRDGNPWWDSTDLWVVPGDDPYGAPGPPVAGKTNYAWARVRNTGQLGIAMGRVDFFWSNPAAGVRRSTSTLIGSSFVDLEPNEVADVLCLAPWKAVIVNDGHECLLAQVVHPSDPLPSPLPDLFDAPLYRQVAQRNVTVIAVPAKRVVLPIAIGGVDTEPQRARISVERDPRRASKELLATCGAGGLEPGDWDVEAGFDTSGSSDLQPYVELDLVPGRPEAAQLEIRRSDPAPSGYRLLHVVVSTGAGRIGGLTVMLLGQDEERR